MRQKEDITLNICYTKTCSFLNQHTTQPAFFQNHEQSTEENTLFRVISITAI